MSDTANLLSSIEKNILKLLAENRSLREENDKLLLRVEEVNRIINQQKEQIHHLENRHFVETLTGSIQGQSSETVRERLSELLNEIDKCIEIVKE
jgi:sugar-specific transcriptional regulator TrmB